MANDLNGLIDALPGLVWTAGLDGKVDFLNKRWQEYTGVGLPEASGHGWTATIHPEDRTELIERWRSILETGVPQEMDARLRRFDGTYRWFLLRTAPVHDAQGRIVKWCGINTDIEDRWRDEEALRLREGRFRLIVEGMPAFVTLRTPENELEFASRQVLDYFGASLEEMKAWGTEHTFHPDDRACVNAALKQSIDTGEPCDVEVRRLRADGVYRWFHMRGCPLRDSEGKIILWYLLHTDVDDRRRAEDLLAGEKQLLEMVASGSKLPQVLDALCRLGEMISEGSRCGILLLAPGGNTWQHCIGPSLPPAYSDIVHGRPAHETSSPGGLAACLKAQVIISDLRSDSRWDLQGWRDLALAHGFQSCWASPILSRNQEALGTLDFYQCEIATPTPFQRELMRQLTHIASIAIERARAESALRRSETFLAEAQRLSSTGSFSWRVATDEITWSEQTCRIFGIDPGIPVTLDFIASRVHPDDLPLMADMLAHAHGDGSDFEYEHRLVMPDRSIKYLHMLAQGTRDQDGQLEYIGAVRDVTQTRLSEEALSKVRSELAHMARVTSLGALTASIAHEVNQPLSGVITNASTCLRMLAAEPPNIDGASETARRTIRDGHRASKVITRLRALFGKKETLAEWVDLNEATREVIALSMSELHRSRAVLRQELADDLPNVMGDRVQLQQVILNLLLNASEAMSGVHDRPRQVVIKTHRDDEECVRVTVQDAGVGIDPKDMDRLFEAFYTTKSSGMGVGLSVSRSIVDSHRGRLWAAVNDGPGATFSFSIPLVPGTTPKG
ncbi:MAG TPA: PAS domain-containing protein [Steroidobacteraceae bacterium]|jgi:PAS domain S-box-containing protein